jgi:hypothetical protein
MTSTTSTITFEYFTKKIASELRTAYLNLDSYQNSLINTVGDCRDGYKDVTALAHELAKVAVWEGHVFTLERVVAIAEGGPELGDKHTLITDLCFRISRDEFKGGFGSGQDAERERYRGMQDALNWTLAVLAKTEVPA